MDLHQIILAATEAVQTAAEVGAAAIETGHEAEAAPTGIVGTLGLNWKLFLAQLVNFGIVLFVFWKWVVKPLGETLTKRQERIEQGLKHSDLMEIEKQKFEQWKQEEMGKVRSEADRIMRSSTESAEKIKTQTVGEAQAQATKLLEQTRASIEAEKTRMVKEAKEEITSLVIAAAEKIIRAKLDPQKDQELINESVRSIK